MLVSCDGNDAAFDDYFTQDEQQGNESADTPEESESTTDTEPENEQEITLTILSYKDGDYFIQDFPELFTKLYPHISISFEFYDTPEDTATQLALTTRLLADPPDILLFSSSSVNFEKMSMDTLFLDYYELFNGPRGISTGDYFSNIYHATESQGGLYSVPIFVELMLAYPNIRLFEGVGVDPASISSVAIDDEIGFYSQISRAFPDERIYPTTRFSLWRALTRNPLYNIDTGEVYANTPEMAERLSRAMDIRVNRDYIEFTPDTITEFFIANTDIARDLVKQSDLIFMDSADGAWRLFRTA